MEPNTNTEPAVDPVPAMDDLAKEIETAVVEDVKRATLAPLPSSSTVPFKRREPDVMNLMNGIRDLYQQLVERRRNEERNWQDQRLAIMREAEDRVRQLDAEAAAKMADTDRKLDRIRTAVAAIR